jgi:hypothetical protein
MLSDEEIRTALHASRVIPVSVNNPHGPFGLEELAGVIERLMNGQVPRRDQVQRPVTLPLETWTKLDHLAQELGKSQSQRVSASDVITALVIQGLNAAQSS